MPDWLLLWGRFTGCLLPAELHWPSLGWGRRIAAFLSEGGESSYCMRVYARSITSYRRWGRVPEQQQQHWKHAGASSGDLYLASERCCWLVLHLRNCKGADTGSSPLLSLTKEEARATRGKTLMQHLERKLHASVVRGYMLGQEKLG